MVRVLFDLEHDKNIDLFILNNKSAISNSRVPIITPFYAIMILGFRSAQDAICTPSLSQL
jgi:hypothetical protein